MVGGRFFGFDGEVDSQQLGFRVFEGGSGGGSAAEIEQVGTFS